MLVTCTLDYACTQDKYKAPCLAHGKIEHKMLKIYLFDTAQTKTL